LSEDDNLEMIQQRIFLINQLPPGNQTLIFNEDKIDNLKSFYELGIRSKSVIQLLPSVTVVNNTVDPAEMFEVSF
jgi:hypothetical protein